MAWWIWLILGLGLLSLEMFAIDAQFYLIFIGAGAIVVGLIEVVGIDLPPWSQWVLFAVLSLLAMFTIRKQLYEKTRGRAVGFTATGAGDRIRIDQALAPGDSCRASYRGTEWTAINVGSQVIPSGASAIIDAIDGLKLKVRLSR